ncbi:MAG: dethiobiotin synthase [Bacteriovoracaceae bacterium]
MKEIIFVTGIDTNIGKTISSSVLVEALEADYWKPVQCGDLENSDSMKVSQLISNEKTKIHPETYRLKTPASPHLAAEIENIEISLENFDLPSTQRPLVIEGAGGILVPLNNSDTIINLAQKFKAKVILVTKNYLGSLNHTLLSIEYLKSLGLPIKGMIFNGKEDEGLENFLIQKTNVPKLVNIPWFEEMNPALIKEMAIHLKRNLT